MKSPAICTAATAILLAKFGVALDNENISPALQFKREVHNIHGALLVLPSIMIQ